MKKKEIAEKIAKKVGGPLISVIVNEGHLNPTKYLRARVFLMLDTPLVRFVPLTLKESKKYPMEYEKLHDFCDFYGLMRHVVIECGDGIHSADECEWGSSSSLILMLRREEEVAALDVGAWLAEEGALEEVEGT